MTRQLPPHLNVRYDYHEHPAGVSAVVFSPHSVYGSEAAIKAVGYAKFNQRDPYFDYGLGERIALGRALAKLERQHGRAPRIVRGRDQMQDLEDSLKASVQRGMESNVAYLQRNAQQILRDFNGPRRDRAR